jgi:hypothetical protein
MYSTYLCNDIHTIQHVKSNIDSDLLAEMMHFFDSEC